MTVDQYLARRRYWETALIVGVLLLSLAANIGVAWIDLSRVGVAAAGRQAVILEVTSHIGLLLALPMVIWFDSRIPVRIATWKSCIPAHAVFSLLFSLVHVTSMYWIRILTFRSITPDSPYVWNNWGAEFYYEYLKDFRTYILILAFIYLYRFVIRRLQGEAGFVDENDDAEPPQISDRFLIRKFGREFLVRMNDIDWIESCGNYVNLHVADKVYPLRGTMTNISERLAGHGFQRVHRSAIVNLDRVSEIVAYDTGDGEARLDTNITVPVSRRFKQELRERLG